MRSPATFCAAVSRTTAAVYKERKASCNSKVIRLSRVSTQRVTGLKIEPNKRNYNDKYAHARYRINKRKEYANEDGRDWTETITGRPSKEQLVADWKAAHPEGTQYACVKDLGIDKKTVRRWWNPEPEDYKEIRSKQKEQAKQALEEFRNLNLPPVFRNLDFFYVDNYERLRNLPMKELLMELKKEYDTQMELEIINFTTDQVKFSDEP